MRPLISTLGSVIFLTFSATAAFAQTDISYEDVLRNPQDPELNVRFAEQRMAAGDIVSAASTLERLLAARPNWDEVRLLYAGALYRAGDFAAARREIALLKTRSLSPEAAKLLASYESKVNDSTKETRFSGTLSVGGAYDENAVTLFTEDAGDGSSQFGSSLDQFSFVGRANLRVERDLSSTKDIVAYGVGQIYTKRFEDSDLDGFLIGTLRAGIKGSAEQFDWRVGLVGRDVDVQGNDFLTEGGVEAAVKREVGGRTSFGLTGSYIQQDFKQVFGTGDAAPGRDGARVDVTARARHAFSSDIRSSFAVSYRKKDADVQDLAYDFWGSQVGLDVFFEDGMYLDSDLFYRRYAYDGSFGSASGDREDDYVYARIAAGSPLETLFGFSDTVSRLPLTAEIALYHTNRQSNVDVFTYNSTGIEARLIYDFGRNGLGGK